MCDELPKHENLFCQYRRQHFFQASLKTDNRSDTTYQSEEYLNRVKQKLLIVEEFVVNEPIGTTILVSDTDVVFTANPFKYELSKPAETNLWFSTNSRADKNQRSICSGLFYLRVSKDTRMLLKVALEELNAGNSKDKGDQGAISQALNKTGIPWEVLPVTAFMNGRAFFRNGTEQNVTVALHLNWVQRLSKKTDIMKAIGLWFGPPVNGRRIKAPKQQKKMM
eukprot:Selendium_serpulae@DN3946_c0_g1_i1.p1